MKQTRTPKQLHEMERNFFCKNVSWSNSKEGV